MKKQLLLYILLISLLSSLTHFLFFGQPNETVFDEVHFGKFISGYFTGEYFFDIHPPLGKLMISGVGWLTGFKPGFSFSDIGQNFPDQSYLWLRLLPAFTGTILPIVIFLLAIQLGLSRLAAFVAGMLVVLENSLLVQSRFILLDSFLLLFGFSSLLAYLTYRKNKNRRFLLTAGILGSLALSIKWTGATFLALIILLEIARGVGFGWHDFKKAGKKILIGFSCLILIPLSIYFLTFALHFGLLPKSGSGDAFMTPAFQKTLQGNVYNKNPGTKTLNVFQKFSELNFEMYRANARLTATHPYSSKWYSWPFMIRPIYYWNGSTSSPQAGSVPQTNSGQTSDKGQETSEQAITFSRIYLLGNPVIWWASTTAILYLLLTLAIKIWRGVCRKIGLCPSAALAGSADTTDGQISNPQWLLGGAFILNLLPFIGINRAMFLYHYFTALIFAIIALVYLIEKTPNKKKVLMILLAASAAAFIFFAPLTYGLPLDNASYNARVWLKTWE